MMQLKNLEKNLRWKFQGSLGKRIHFLPALFDNSEVRLAAFPSYLKPVSLMCAGWLA
jgi:hypothetical protein